MKKDPKILLMLEAAKSMKDDQNPFASEEGEPEDEDEDMSCTCPECGHEFIPE